MAEAKQSKERGYRGWPAALTAAFAAVAPAQTHLFAARYRGQIVAQMLFLTHGQRATYHIGHSTPEGRRVSAHNLLMWTAMRKLAKIGIEHLDLGGINTHDSPGIARFKLGTGGTVKTLCGTWFGR